MEIQTKTTWNKFAPILSDDFVEIRTKLGGLLLTVILQKNNLVFFRSMCKTPNFVVFGSTRKTLTWWFWKTLAWWFCPKLTCRKIIKLLQQSPLNYWQHSHKARDTIPLNLNAFYSTPLNCHFATYIRLVIITYFKFSRHVSKLYPHLSQIHQSFAISTRSFLTFTQFDPYFLFFICHAIAQHHFHGEETPFVPCIIYTSIKPRLLLPPKPFLLRCSVLSQIFALMMFYSRRWPFPSSTIIQTQESMIIMANWIVLIAPNLSLMANFIMSVSSILHQMVL